MNTIRYIKLHNLSKLTQTKASLLIEKIAISTLVTHIRAISIATIAGLITHWNGNILSFNLSYSYFDGYN